MHPSAPSVERALGFAGSWSWQRHLTETNKEKRHMSDDSVQREPDTFGRSELPKAGYRATRVARVRTIPGEPVLKVGEFDGHEVYSDEGPKSGGEDRYPTPLGYMALAVGF